MLDRLSSQQRQELTDVGAEQPRNDADADHQQRCERQHRVPGPMELERRAILGPKN
jgi:hypothetical protein